MVSSRSRPGTWPSPRRASRPDRLLRPSKRPSSHPAAVASALEQHIPFWFERAQDQEEAAGASFEEVPQEVWADGWHRALSSLWSRRESQ
eukprot:8733799-Pyramimonas_sp.AAC.1